MLTGVSKNDLRARVSRDNPWWESADYMIPEASNPRRVYFPRFKTLALNFAVRRAAILLGPRRVGKTFMIKQLIHEAIGGGIDPRAIVYTSIDAPIFSGLSLERFVQLAFQITGHRPRLVIFDEIQYLRDWEVHLKDLVDNYADTKFVASGSAAAALRLKSRESGAGRFSEFMLPPLTFFEFLQFSGTDASLISQVDERTYEAKDIDALNSAFLDYLNFGGYPEAVLNREIRRNAEQFIRNDIIDKVLLKDLPSLYGINEIQELNKLFSFLAYNAGNEASLENIAQGSGITKPTIKKYIEYLESAFLIIKLSTVDENCKTMTRERNFKVYLNNPSMRAALFSPLHQDDAQRIGHLAECAVFSQWQHSPSFRDIKYARWRNGEVDVVYLGHSTQKPYWIGEIKWSDKIVRNPADQTRSIKTCLAKHSSIKSAFFTTRTHTGVIQIEGRELKIFPTALYCYTVGRNITSTLESLSTLAVPKTDKPALEIHEEVNEET